MEVVRTLVAEAFAGVFRLLPWHFPLGLSLLCNATWRQVVSGADLLTAGCVEIRRMRPTGEQSVGGGCVIQTEEPGWHARVMPRVTTPIRYELVNPTPTGGWGSGRKLSPRLDTSSVK